jgi:NitT/TauT family transport system substrate-binding protein
MKIPLGRSIATAVTVVTLGALTACSSTSTPGASPDTSAPVHVTVAEQGVADLSSGVAPHLADELGYFEEEGIVVDEFVSVQKGQDAINGMISGSVTFSHTAPEAIVANQNGADIVGIATSWASPALFGVAAPGIDSWEDLKGKTIAIGAPNDIVAVIVKDLLAKAGLDPETDVQYVPLGATPARVQAVLNGQADATVATIQGSAEQVESGELISLGAAPDGTEQVALLNSAIQSPRTWVESNPEATVAYLRAIDRAITYMKDPANEDDVVSRIHELNQVPEGAIAEAVDYFLLNPPENTAYYPADMRMPEDTFASTVDAYKMAELLGADVEVTEDDFMDYSFADEALKG